MKIDQFTKSSAPITVIVNISNPVAVKLARILLEQGSRLLIVDKLSLSRRKMLGDLLNNENCLFMDSESTFRNIGKFKKIDYVYYFLSQITTGSTYPSLLAESMEIQPLSHKDFIRESNRVDAYLKLALEFRATVTLVTSAYLAQFLEIIPEMNIQIQKYAESLVHDYIRKNKLDARIVRVGELIGEEGDFASPTNTARLLREILLREKVNVFGDGLQQNYLVHCEDAVYALLKATFSKKAVGETFLAAYSHPFTSLSLAYQLLELTIDEKQVVFNEVLPDYEEVLKLNEHCIAKSATEIGWEPHIPLEQALAESLESLAKAIHFTWKPVAKTATVEVTNETGVVSESTGDGTKHGVEKVPQKATRNVVQGAPGFLYLMYHRFIAEPTLWLLSLPKRVGKTYEESGEKVKKASLKSVMSLVLAILVIWIAVPYMDFVITGVKTVVLAEQFQKDVAALDTSRFAEYASKFPAYAETLVGDYEQVSYWQAIPGVGTKYTEVGKLLQGYALYAKSSAAALRASAPAIQIIKGIAEVTPNSPAGQVSREYYAEIEEIMKYRNDIVQASQEAQVAELRLSRVQTDKLPGFVVEPFTKSKDILSAYTTSIEELERSYDLIPYLLGYKDRRTYFIMLQNETELRATGGWFTNYAIVGIENGQVRELTVNDVYNAEGQMTGLPAPADMKRGLDIATYKIGLSNWDPEVRNVSEDIATLLAQTGKYKPNDVTITVNFGVIGTLLEVVGPIQVEDLGEITKQNLFDKVGQLHSEFTPGSQAKVSVVSDFVPKLLNAIVTASPEKKQQVIQVLLDSIPDRDIMVYSTDPLFRTRVLDSYDTYRTINPEDNPLYIVDWNWGGNKANRYTKRVVDLVIDETDFTADVLVSYTNESTSEDYPQGTYKNVQRVYYPTSFSLKSYEGYTLVPKVFESHKKNVPYTLARMQVGTRSAQDTKLVFNIKEMPSTLSLYKQPGIGTEVVRVAIIQKDLSSISEQKLREQGFAKIDNTWTKTYIRTEDVVIKLK